MNLADGARRGNGGCEFSAIFLWYCHVKSVAVGTILDPPPPSPNGACGRQMKSVALFKGSFILLIHIWADLTWFTQARADLG